MTNYAIDYKVVGEHGNAAGFYVYDEEDEKRLKRFGGKRGYHYIGPVQQRPSVLLRKIKEKYPDLAGVPTCKYANLMHAAMYTAWLAARMKVCRYQDLLRDDGLLHELAHFMAYGTTYVRDMGLVDYKDKGEWLVAGWAALEEKIPCFLPRERG